MRAIRRHLIVAGIIFALTPSAFGQKIPPTAEMWRGVLTDAAYLEWGHDAPIATMAAQIHQESAWRPDARSPVGAEGIAQFMGATATWLASFSPALGGANRLSPEWSIRAMAAYDKFLWDRAYATTDCHRGAKALSAYNGGESWVKRDETKAASAGLDPDLWWGNVERVNSGRSLANWRENRGYPHRILFLLEPLYIKNKWGRGLCYDEVNGK